MEEVTETILDLSHLTLQAQALAILPGAERINRIRSNVGLVIPTQVRLLWS